MPEIYVDRVDAVRLRVGRTRRTADQVVCCRRRKSSGSIHRGEEQCSHEATRSFVNFGRVLLERPFLFVRRHEQFQFVLDQMQFTCTQFVLPLLEFETLLVLFDRALNDALLTFANLLLDTLQLVEHRLDLFTPIVLQGMIGIVCRRTVL